MLEWITAELAGLERDGMLRRIPPVEGTGRYLFSEDSPAGMLNLSSNDYLGLQERDDLRHEFLRSAEYKLSSSSSRLLTGNTQYAEELEEYLASAYGKGGALLFNSGYHANTGILPAIAGDDSVIIADKLVHASIIDGLKLAERPFARYRHNDYNHLESILKKEAGKFRDVFVVTEGIFSMDGDCADIGALVELKKRYPNVILYVDEAHAFGTRGKNGLGISSEYEGGLEPIDIIVGTFGKAVCSVGAFVACSKPVREYLVNKSRSLIFSTSLPPINTAWTLFIVKKLPQFERERKYLKELSQYVRKNLVDAGSAYSAVSSSNIIPYMTYTADAAAACSAKLQRMGFYLLPIRPPTVPPGKSRIRISLTAGIAMEEIEPLFRAIK